MIRKLLFSLLLLSLAAGVHAAQPDIEDWTDVAWSPDGNFLIGVQNEIVLYNREMRLIERFDPHHMRIDRIAWSPDSSRFALSADDSFPGSEADSVISIWAIPDFAMQREVQYGNYETDRPEHLETIANTTWHPDGQRIFSTVMRSGEMLLAQWDAVTLQPTLLSLERPPAFMRAFALSPQGGKLALSGVFGAAPETYFALQMLDSESGVWLWEQRGGENVIVSISWLWLSEEIFAAARGDTIEIWNAATGELQQTLQAEPDAGIYKIRWSPDGQFIAVLKFGGDLTIWSVATGERVLVVYAGNGVTQGVLAFDWHPDGRSIAAALADEWNLRLFDVSGIYGG